MPDVKSAELPIAPGCLSGGGEVLRGVALLKLEGACQEGRLGRYRGP